MAGQRRIGCVGNTPVDGAAGRRRQSRHTFDAQRALDVQIRHNWWLVTAAGATTCLIATADGTTRASVTFAQADHARMRLQDDHF